MNALVYLELAHEYRRKRQLPSKINMRKQRQAKKLYLARTLSNLKNQKPCSTNT